MSIVSCSSHRVVAPTEQLTALRLFCTTYPGEIINWVALDREQHSQHSLKVMVTDQGHPRLNATAAVHILVTDVNDNAPRFTHLPASKELNVQVGMSSPQKCWFVYESPCGFCTFNTLSVNSMKINVFLAICS